MRIISPHEIVLSAAQVAQLRLLAAKAFPQECCGLLVGTGDDRVTLTEIVPTANVADAPEHRFAVDPQVQFDLLRRLRGSDQRVVGHYHSHPNGVAQLSVHDLAMAHDPSAIWLLTPVGADGQAGDPVAFICATLREAAPLPLIVSNPA